jgi:integrase
MQRRSNSIAKARARAAKVQALADRAGTPGEQVAAEAAAVRLGTALEPLPSRGAVLDAKLIKRLPSPPSGSRITFDGEVAGFGVRVTAAGFKAFVFNFRVKGNGQQRRVTIGGFPNWTTGAARAKARELRRQVDDGGDPRGEFTELRDAPTVDSLCDRFVREHLPKRRPGTARNYTDLLDLHIRPFFGKHAKAADVSYSDIDKLHTKVTQAGSPYAANRTVAVLSRMFSLAIRWGLRSDNPARGIERNAETKRKRYLKGDEWVRLTEALAKHANRQFANIIRVLILTGARKGEVLGMKWADLDLDRGTWSKPGSTTKQKTDHVVPLSVQVVQLLNDIETRGEFIFPSVGKTGHVTDIQRPWDALCKSAAITGLRIHDLRHSFASQLINSGHGLALIGALLGHSNPNTTARYSHLFDDPQRAAVEKLSELVGDAGKGGRHG